MEARNKGQRQHRRKSKRFLAQSISIIFLLQQVLFPLSNSSLSITEEVGFGFDGSAAAASTATYGLSNSSYLGGAGEDAIRDMVLDDAGNMYLVGSTASSDFPVTNGVYDSSFNGAHDIFVMKLSPQGNLIWATFLGGPNDDRGYAIQVDGNQNVYVAGGAGQNFPTTAGVIQPSFGGDVNPDPATGAQDGFIAKLLPDGTGLVWSTYFGSDGSEIIRDIDIDSLGNVFVATSGVTRPHPFISAGVFQASLNGPSDGVIAKLSPNGASVLYAGYFGGSGDDGDTPSIRVDGLGFAYYLTHTTSSDLPVTANALQSTYGGNLDLALAKISPDGSSLIYSTYLGGSDVEFSEANGLAVDALGVTYVGATTLSTNFPVTAGAFQTTHGGSATSEATGQNTDYPGDGFISKISANGASLLAGTFVGGSAGEGLEGIALDADGNVYFGGASFSANFPVTPDAFQPALDGNGDFIIGKLSPNLNQLLYSSYLGGFERDYEHAVAVSGDGALCVAGASESADWPLQNALQTVRAGGWDGVLGKFVMGSALPQEPPTVDAGADQTIMLGSIAQLNGTIVDDGLPLPPGQVTALWSQVGGPAPLTFGDIQSEDTTATFSQAGTYVLRLTANDGDLAASDDVIIFVESAATWPAIETVGPSADTYVKLNDSVSHGGDTEILAKADTINLRYGYVKFDTAQSEGAVLEATLRLRVRNVGWPAPGSAVVREFTDNSWNEFITWANRPSDSVMGAQIGASLALPATEGHLWEVDVTDYVRIRRESGQNIISFTLRSTVANDGGAGFYSRESSTPPELILRLGDPNNQAPTVNAGADQIILMNGSPITVNLAGTVTDDGLPDPPAAVGTTWSKVSGPGNVTFGDASALNTTVTISTPGTYTLRLTADDGEQSTFDEVRVSPPATGVGLERIGTDQVYFTHNGMPLLSFGGGSDFIFYQSFDAFDYIRWADWAEAHGINHIRAYPPFSWKMIETSITENGGSLSNALFPYRETSPGSRQFDLTQFDPAYWARFRAQCEYLQSKGIIIHLLMINGWQAEPGVENWDAHFFNPVNNINSFTDHLAGVPAKFYSSVADNKTQLVSAQQAWFRKLIEETHDLDNVYYDLVHESAGFFETWAKMQQWIDTMAQDIRNYWAQVEPAKPIVLGMDGGGYDGISDPIRGSQDIPQDGSQLDWIYTRPYFDIAIYGKAHFAFNAREWRKKYDKPYIPQESWDDTYIKQSYRNPTLRISTRKYMWKMMMAKCQQMDLYYKQQGTPVLPGYPHNYDPNGWNPFEGDAFILRQFWNSLTDYPDLWFNGTVLSGPGSHKFVLSSSEETIAYVSSASNQQNVSYGSQTLKLRNLSVADGAYAADIIKPSVGVTETRSVIITGGSIDIQLPSFVDDIVVHIYSVAAANEAPTVNAGTDQNILFESGSATANLSGNVTDDGLPNPPASWVTTWSQVSGPGQVIFANPSASLTTADFNQEGSYILRLSADDSELSSYDDIVVTATSNPTDPALGTVLPIADTYVKLNDSTTHGTETEVLAKADLINIRYGYVKFDTSVLNGQTVNVILQLKVHGIADWSSPGSAVIRPFTDNSWTESMNWSNRPSDSAMGTTLGSIQVPAAEGQIWEIDVTDYVRARREAGQNVISFALRSTAPNNSGIGIYSRESATPPQLIFSLGTGPSNEPPVVVAGPDQAVELTSNPAMLNLDGSVTDDGLPNPPSVVDSTWTQIGGPSAVAFENPDSPDTMATFSEEGIYVLRLSAHDGEFVSFDDVTVNVEAVTPPAVGTVLPVADTYVKLNDSTSYGSATRVLAKGDLVNMRHGFIKFDTSTLQGAVENVTLRLKVKAVPSWPRASTAVVRAFTNNSWAESINWATRPSDSAMGATLGTLSLPAPDGFVWQIDATDYVRSSRAAGQNFISFTVRSTAPNNGGTGIHSRESSAPPELVFSSNA